MVLFEPFPYDHAAGLIGCRPWEVSRSPELMQRAFATAIGRYQLKQVVLGIDIYNLEAETLGCEIAEPAGNASPQVAGPVCTSPAHILELKAQFGGSSRFPWLLQVAASLRRQFPNCVVKIPLTGPFTLAGHLLGLENLLCECLLHPADTRLSLQHLAGVLLEFIRQAAAAGFDVTLFESSASPPMLSPALFGGLLKPVLHELMAAAEQCLGERPALIMGGDTLPVLAHILDLRPSYIICPIETDQPQFVERCLQAGQPMHLRVNMQPHVFTHDSPDELLREAARAAQLAERYPTASVGTILPFETRPEQVHLAAGFFNNRN